MMTMESSRSHRVAKVAKSLCVYKYQLATQVDAETKTIPGSDDVYSYSSLPRLDSPPTNAHSTFQQIGGSLGVLQTTIFPQT
jgi:hypothetical protein